MTIVTNEPAGAVAANADCRVVRRPGVLCLFRLYAAADFVIVQGLALRLGWPLLAGHRRALMVHHMIPGPSENPITARLRVKLTSRVRHATVSHATAQGLPWPIDAVLPNPYDAAVFQRDANLCRTREVIFVGRLIPEKGADVLIDVLGILQRSRRRVSATIVGRVIALSVPVDYWDYLGWKDTLAQHAHSLRQRGYAGARGDRQVYTPQVVVNGTAQVIGSDRAAIEAACKSAAKATVPVTLTRNGDNVEFDIGAGQGAPASVWLLTVAHATPVEIGRGENHGRTVTYSNVVRSWQRVAEWTGAPMKNSVPLPELNAKDADAIVILVQPGSIENPGPVRGASMIELR